MYNTPTDHDLAQVQISLHNNVQCRSHFSFLFINRLKIAWDSRAYLWRIWICVCLIYRLKLLILQANYIAEEMDAKWLQKHCTKPCSAKSRNNGNGYSIHLHYVWCTVYYLMKLSVNKVPKCHLQAYYVKRNGDMKGHYYITVLIIMQHYESVLCSSSLHLFDQKYRNIIILWNIITI